MKHRLTIHYLNSSSRDRAAFVQMVTRLGHHVEVYHDMAELIECKPSQGVVVASDDASSGGITNTIDTLARAQISLPVIAVAPQPCVARTVQAMKSGALDYLATPLDPAIFSRSLDAIAVEARHFAEARQRMFEARDRISSLSRREREVLDLLASGHTNKAIARDLGISPRTVEIHRANMMAKLDAGHAADVVRLSLEAQM